MKHKTPQLFQLRTISNLYHEIRDENGKLVEKIFAPIETAIQRLEVYNYKYRLARLLER